jgi:hypothetical protein
LIRLGFLFSVEIGGLKAKWIFREVKFNYCIHVFVSEVHNHNDMT